MAAIQWTGLSVERTRSRLNILVHDASVYLRYGHSPFPAAQELGLAAGYIEVLGRSGECDETGLRLAVGKLQAAFGPGLHVQVGGRQPKPKLADIDNGLYRDTGSP